MVSTLGNALLVGSLTLASASAAPGASPADPWTVVQAVAPARALAFRALPLVTVDDAASGQKVWTLIGRPRVSLPAHAAAPWRFAAPRPGGATFTLTAVDVVAARGEPRERALVQHDVAIETDAVLFATPEGAEELRILRSPTAPRAFRYVLALGPGCAGARLTDGRIEILDAAGRVAFTSPPPRAWDRDGHDVPMAVALAATGTRTYELVLTARPRPDAPHPLVVDPTWQYVPTPGVSDFFLAQGISWNALADGSALVAGGLGFEDTATIVVQDEVFVVSKSLELVAHPKMPGPRWAHATAVVGDGVVFAGGNAGADIIAPVELSSVLLYKPATKTWKTLPNLQRPRQAASALALPTGKVLVLGGSGAGGSQTLLDIVDPGAGTTTKGASMKSTRIHPAMALLADGRVFVAGGLNRDSEIYDPATNTWTAGPDFPVFLDDVDVHRLPSGKLLAIPHATTATKTTYLVDASLAKVVEGPPMITAHPRGASTQLLDGRVLVAGGRKGTTDLVDAEMYDEATGVFTAIEPLDVPRSLPSLVTLADGRVLVGNTPPGVMNILLGGKCTDDTMCATGTCADGRCCATACDGRCTACDVPGREGTCSPVTGKERATGHASCAPYGTCAAGLCVRECRNDDDCATGNVCYASGTCAPPRALCDGDHTVTDKESGHTVDCAPYRCGSAGDCKKSCASSSDCAPSAACAEGRCTFPTVAGEDGGCSTGRGRAGGLSLVFGVLAALGVLRRRTLALSLAAAGAGCSAESRTAPPSIEAAPAPDATLLQRFPRLLLAATAPRAPRLSVTSPVSGSAGLRIARTDRPDVWLDTRPVGDTPSIATTAGGFAIHPHVRLATDVYVACGVDRVEELRLLADASAPTTTTYRVTHGPGVAGLRVRGRRFEAFDDQDVVVFASEPVWAQDSAGVVRDPGLTATPDGDGHLLSVTVDTAGLVFPVLVDPAWRATGLHRGLLLNVAAAQLDSGNVVTLAKPSTGDPPAQLFDATSHQWKAAGSPTLPRDLASALRTGPTRALFVGGGSYSGSVLTALRTVDVYDETTNAWTAADPLVTARSTPWLVALPGNRVMALGGNTGTTHVSTSEIYDAATGKWSPGPNATGLHGSGHPVVLADGRTLMVDGKRSEVFDPKTMTWAPIALPPAGIDVTALLPDGRVLAVGDKTLIYDPKTNAWSDGPAFGESHAYSATAATLRSGSILLIGGENDAYHTVATVERFDPIASKWTYVQPLPEPREDAFAFTLPKGEVLLFGGMNDTFVGTLNPLLYNLEDGLACGADAECASGFCTDGVCCNARCRGACDACDGAKKGTCTASDAAPKPGHGSCEPFAGCKAGKCIDRCASDADCVSGTACFVATGKCTDKGASCDGDHLLTLASGAVKDCAPYRCAPSGDCNTVCATSADCVGGAACDDGVCHLTASAPAEPGGCATPGAGARGGLVGLGLLPLFAWLRRRRAAPGA